MLRKNHDLYENSRQCSFQDSHSVSKIFEFQAVINKINCINQQY